jgi:polyhydroxyalkanoate synthesis repressor PhaR
MEMMNQEELRVIKKYPNRRLYDTAISSYITMDDVRSLVMEQVKFSIQDAKTGEDITRSVLLQIILEQEEGGEPIFSSEVLSQLIRFYGNTLQGIIASYFERSLTLFSKQQEEFREKMYTPLSFMTDLAEQNITLWRDVQESFFRAALTGNPLEREDKKNQKTTE